MDNVFGVNIYKQRRKGNKAMTFKEGKFKLTDEQAINIYHSRDVKFAASKLAGAYGVNRTTAYQIIRGITYRKLTKAVKLDVNQSVSIKYTKEKICPSCKVMKPLEAYYIVPNATHRRSTLCMPCEREYKHTYSLTDGGTIVKRRTAKKMKQKYPEKHSARAKLRYAVKTGKIIKPVECENCSNVLPLHGHHEDYDKPLDVKWLCTICHLDAHGIIVDSSLLKEKIV